MNFFLANVQGVRDKVGRGDQTQQAGSEVLGAQPEPRGPCQGVCRSQQGLPGIGVRVGGAGHWV